jgi:tetratricopeptide (TPR) repeat protein
MAEPKFEVDKDNFEFQVAYDLIAETNQSLFITGRAGTGKSTLLKYAKKNIKKNFVIVAPTGIAAMNVGGATIHSFFGLPPRPLMRDDDDIRLFPKGHPKRKMIEQMDTLFIDEVSMVRADIIDAIDTSLRRNGLFPKMPFGGKQVVFIGDLFQLEPVSRKGSEEHAIMEEMYDSPFFFNAQVFRNFSLQGIELQVMYRQKEKQFIALLDKIRNGAMEAEDLYLLNSRCLPLEADRADDYTINLTSRNDIAAQVNKSKLDRLRGRAYNYKGTVEGEFDMRKCPAEEELVLKEGAQVMFLRNDNEKRWVNGTISKVAKLENDSIEVELPDGRKFDVETAEWENKEYVFDRRARSIRQEIKGTFSQFPLALAWAVTIHKSQGLTFDKVIVDLGSGAFAGGQTYVALSRCRTFEGLILKSRVKPQDIFIDERIRDYSGNVNNYSQLERSLESGKEEYRHMQIELAKVRKAKADEKKAKEEIKERMLEEASEAKADKKVKAAGHNLQVKHIQGSTNPSANLPPAAIEANRLYSQGLETIHNKNYAEAIELFEKALELLNEDDSDTSFFPLSGALYKLGLCYYATGNFNTSIKFFTQAILNREDEADYYFYRGAAHYRLKENAEALEDYETALILKPDMAQAAYNMGVVKNLMGDDTGAAYDWKQAANMGHEKAKLLIKG